MEKAALGRPQVFGIQLIGAWPGYRSVYIRTFIWLFMLVTIVCQVWGLLDYAEYKMSSLMEAVAILVTNILSFVKIFCLWYNRGYIEQCLLIMAEDWENISNNEQFVIMSRHAKFARRLCMWVMGSYCSAVLSFQIRLLFEYTLQSPNYNERKHIVPAKYPFNTYRSPNYEIMMGIEVGQGTALVAGNFLSDNVLIALIAHISGQLLILHGRLRRVSDVKELPGIVRKHQRIIEFAENLRMAFTWIGLAEFISGSIIICAVGFVIVTTVESDLDGPTMVKFGTYIIAMILGVFIYCCAGNILFEQTLNVRDAVYECCWPDLPPETSKILIIIMMRADKPLCITAGNFLDMNYESFINIMKTAASYLSVIRAASE